MTTHAAWEVLMRVGSPVPWVWSEFVERLPNRPDWQQPIAALAAWARRLAHAD